MSTLTLIDCEKISQLVYKRNSEELEKFLTEIKAVWSLAVDLENNRYCMFRHENTTYMAVAGSDDLPDWVENFIVIPAVNLYHGFTGYAYPARDIIQSSGITRILRTPVAGIKCAHIVLIGHSRGGAIVQNIFRQIRLEHRYTMNAWTFGNPGGGSKKFAEGTKNWPIVNFDIKGDVVTKLNFLKCDIGRTVDLPRQITGFFNRLKNAFKGKLNHRSYACISKYKPWCNLDAKGNKIEV